MGLEGKFYRLPSQRALGIPIYSFDLKNTNLLFSENFDLMISDISSRQPRFIRNIRLDARQSLTINADSIGWEWCHNDFCAIIDSNNRIIQKWSLVLKEYMPGECPECGGTHRCRTCKGQGYFLSPRNFNISCCTSCGGTGICMTCNIPRRTSQFGLSTTPSASSRNIDAIQAQIIDLQSKINRVEWTMKRMELDGTSLSSPSVYESYCQLRYTYSTQLIKLQSML